MCLLLLPSDKFNSLAPGGAHMRQLIGKSLVCLLFERQIITNRNTALMHIEPKDHNLEKFQLNNDTSFQERNHQSSSAKCVPVCWDINMMGIDW